MKIFEALKNDYFHLFVKRESKVVLGNNFSNLWLLTAVLTAAFLAVAFSNASLNYLAYKMNDPFINWVDIPHTADVLDENYDNMVKDLNESEEYKSLFHYHSVQEDNTFYNLFATKNFEGYNVRARCFEHLDIPLVKAIIDDSNVVNGWSIMAIEPGAESIGVIMTEELMHKMGYEEAPSYIYYMKYASESVTEDYRNYYCVDLINDGDHSYMLVPIPVLAVVRRLPGDFEMVSGGFLSMQMSDDSKDPFNLCKEQYARDLRYFVPSHISVEHISNMVSSMADKYISAEIDIYTNGSFYAPELLPFREGNLLVVEDLAESLSYEDLKDINNLILEKYGREGVYRVYNYDYRSYDYPYTSFVSLYFKDLDKLTEFESFLSNEYRIKIEMSQINAKQNFNAVSLMGNTLSWVIIVFAIICIVLFIVNLLQSYFQKVKRNLGTFKAFGISNRDLIMVYVLILAAIILSAVVISVSVTWLIQGGLHVCGIVKEGFDYLSLWSMKTIYSIVIIIFVSIFTVAAVMRRLLKATPGDLIYDRQ